MKSLKNLDEKDAGYLFQSLLESIPDAIYFKDLDSRFILLNQATVRRANLGSPDEAIGKSDFDIFGEEHARAAFNDEQQIIRTGIALMNKEEREVWADGTITWVSTTKLPLRNRHGEIIGTFGVSRDITLQKQNEEKLRQSQEGFKEQAALLDEARDGIIVRNLEGTILFWNKGAERIYGWTREEVVGRNILEKLYTNAKKFEEVNQTTMSHGEWRGELPHFTKDGREIIIDSCCTLIRDDEKHPKSVLAINTDITERRRIEDQLLRAQRVESLGTLAGGIAHDLNNTLTPIMMSIELLRASIEDPKATGILNSIQSSAERGAAIVRQILSFARGMKGERTEVQLNHLLKEIQQIIKDSFPKNIQLEISTPSDLWTISGDPTQLHQMLLNLCVNARDAMPNGGILKIHAENRHLDHQFAVMNNQAKAGPFVSLSIADSGVGIPREVIDKIFDPFFTTKDFGKGTGLGLSTAMGIVKSHEGFITVYSEPDKGSTFHIHLPANALSNATPSQQDASSFPRGHGETILVVDDEIQILTMITETLVTFGYRVLTASNGAEAIATYTKNQSEIALVFTDMSMPIMDGLSTIHAIKHLNPGARIIAASGLHSDGTMAKAAAANIHHFLDKPCTTKTLLEALRKALDD